MRLVWDGRQLARTWAWKQRNVRHWKLLPSNVTEDTGLCVMLIQSRAVDVANKYSHQSKTSTRWANCRVRNVKARSIYIANVAVTLSEGRVPTVQATFLTWPVFSIAETRRHFAVLRHGIHFQHIIQHCRFPRSVTLAFVWKVLPMVPGSILDRYAR
jgi:hypothetical protein